MTSEHLDEPLAYLYEELPPDRMAAARRHLAECPQCRETLREIRDTVKAYRQAPRPSAPAGLAARAAARALAEANAEPAEFRAVAEAEALPEPAADGVHDPEFDRIKQEILAETRGTWRMRLFHPAWTVAASVLFVCAVLIHVSPRGNRWAETTADAPAPMSSPSRPAPADAAAPALLPAPKPVQKREDAEYQPVPPLLRQAEQMGARLDLDAPTVEPTGSAAPLSPLSSPSSPSPPPSASPAAGVGPKAADAPAMEQPRPPRESWTVRDEKIAEQAERSREIDAVTSPDSRAPAEQAPLAPVAPPAASVAPPVSLPEEDAAPALEIRPPPAASYAAPPADAYPPIVLPEQGGSLPADAPAEYESISEPGFVDISGIGEAPQVVQRPTPVDVEQSVFNLATLIGMQLAQGEFAEARISIGMLRNFDPKKADELAAILEQMETAAGPFPATEPPAPVEADAAAPEAAPDKYYTPPVPAAPPPEDSGGGGAAAPAAPVPDYYYGSSLDADAATASAFDQRYNVHFPPAPPAAAGAPAVSKSAPGANPPTLWESTAGERAGSVRGRAPWRREANPRWRPFSTDPYVRDD